jgi:hypothetical protein
MLTGSIDSALHLCLPFVVDQCLSGGDKMPSEAQQWLAIKGGRTWLAVSSLGDTGLR